MTDEAPRTTDDTAPCLGCGLCCDGTLFARVEVNAGEQEHLRSAGHELTELSKRTYLAQPCPFSGCGRCTIYETRFETCRSFRCALLRRYQAGEIAGKEARGIVEKAVVLAAKVREGGPEIASYEERHSTRIGLASELEMRKGDMPRARAQRLLDMLALDTFLERWFRNPKRNAESGDDAEEQPGTGAI